MSGGEARRRWWQREAASRDLPPAGLAGSLAVGWNGVRWGESLGAFRERFPGAGASAAWWLTGAGPEVFCGVTMDTQYAFDDDGRFWVVAFYPGAADRERLLTAADDELGPPPGDTLVWPVGDDVVVDVKTAGRFAMIYHRGLMPAA